MPKPGEPRSQIERAQRFAAPMTNDAERKMFEARAFELRRELALGREPRLFKRWRR